MIRKGLLILGIALSLGLLLHFKYSSFFVSVLNDLFEALGLKSKLTWKQEYLPLGISFFSFQVISYLVDLYRREYPAQKSLAKIALYKVFFPQLIAGPIVRYKDVKNELDHRTTSGEDFSQGAFRFVTGLAQKIILSDTLGRTSDVIFALPGRQLGWSTAILGAMSFIFQLYYDFAGYSNMAIGLARIFGFRIPENFLHPHASASITEFWRRWHRSLSTWFRDYLYLPLGGDRGSHLNTGRNLLIVFVLCGLWHGAGVTFVFWGLYNGAFLVFEKSKLGQSLIKLPRLIPTLYSWIVLTLGAVIYRNPNLEKSLEYFKALFGLGETGIAIKPLAQFINPELLLALGLAWYFCYPRSLPSSVPLKLQSALKVGATVGLYVLSIIYLAASNFNPFVYFRF